MTNATVEEGGDGPPIMEIGKFYVNADKDDEDQTRYFCFAYDAPLYGCVAVGYEGVIGFHEDGWSAESGCFRVVLETTDITELKVKCDAHIEDWWGLPERYTGCERAVVKEILTFLSEEGYLVD